MRSVLRAAAALASAALFIAPAAAQTYTNCNPLLRSDCPADSALGRSVNIDFTSASDSFTAQGNPTYSSNGVSFTVAKSGDSPQLTSKWYIMFGKVEVVLKAAPGKGIVSSFVMQSDTLDEIDWEWLGASSEEVQSNYFGKGQTTTYNRGAFHADPGSQAGFKKYTIEWTSTSIVWQIDGVTVRTLVPGNAANQYPQTPMQVKIGAWSGGDPANAPGTIEWARGPTDYTKGPYSMQVKSLMVADYSTGTQYVYGDQSGTYQSIKSTGGKVNTGGGVASAVSPTVTSTVNGQPLPFTPQQSSVSRQSVYPWVPGASSQATATASYANYPGLPSGWTVSSSGKVVPPSSAPLTSLPASFTPSAAASPLASSGGSNPRVITTYDQRGFTTVITLAGASITAAPTQSAVANNKAASSVPPSPSASSAYQLLVNSSLVFLAALLGAGLFL